jgi:hypothetical protein
MINIGIDDALERANIDKAPPILPAIIQNRLLPILIRVLSAITPLNKPKTTIIIPVTPEAVANAVVAFSGPTMLITIKVESPNPSNTNGAIEVPTPSIAANNSLKNGVFFNTVFSIFLPPFNKNVFFSSGKFPLI